jgi:hypothetical protein
MTSETQCVREATATVGPKTRPRWLRAFGPGLITGASDDDPSGIATYPQAGAQLGFTILPRKRATRWSASDSIPMLEWVGVR